LMCCLHLQAMEIIKCGLSSTDSSLQCNTHYIYWLTDCPWVLVRAVKLIFPSTPAWTISFPLVRTTTLEQSVYILILPFISVTTFGFITTYAISVYHHWCCEFKSHSGQGVQHYVIKFANDLWQVSGFLWSSGFLH
jgi:hypothetical protein